MKRFMLLAVVVISVACCGVPHSEGAEGGETLVAYFSWGGNTESVAKIVAEMTGGKLFRITPETPYTRDYDKVVDLAKAEQNRNARPALAAHVDNMDQYGTVFLGYPCWWGTLPMAVFTFLEESDLSGKRVIPFVTHGGSGFGRSLNDLRRLAPNSKIEDGLSVYDTNVSNSRSQVKTWLESNGIATR